MREEITKALQKATGEKNIQIEFPDNEAHGDFSTNIALVLAKKKAKNPREYAEEIVSKLNKVPNLAEIVEKIEIAGPGFINFWLSKESLSDNLKEILSKKENYGKSDSLKGKSYLVEHTSPNTIKTLHVGHVRNNTLGMGVHNLLEALGADVKLDAINNDRGIHVMKAVWAYMKYGEGKSPESEGVKPDHFVDKFYVMGAKMADDEEKIKDEMQELLRKWESGDKEVRDVWKKLRDWTLAGFKETYKRLGSYHDHQWFESDFYEHGKEMVEQGLKKGIFKKLPDGAVLSNLSKYDLSDTIVLRADGTSMYHTQDLYLTKLKREKFPSDLYMWDIGPEQELYLKQLFAMCEQLGIGKKENYFHMAYGFVYLKGGGKMSSRAGNVVSADTLLDEMVGKAKKIIEKSETGRNFTGDEKEKVAEAVGVGAIKYGFSKVGRLTDIYFDINESLSLEGNSGPYLQYTVARTNSVLAKTQKLKNSKTQRHLAIQQFNHEEELVLRALPRFADVIVDAAKSYSPNLLANYLFDLAQKYNNFYNTHRIIDSDNLILRLRLTSATGQILKNGLKLLGIQAPERM
ncbi:arginine--tRNA ligase [Candidatus Woesebacteria bacterium RIFOXYD1_FULL_40_21]|uniref:Arginine--tRNA ligase n=1 Tax=Candidatus Woesebacteria bacterium RIFOXYD1_FULL_40_21 TaxID=1802549 RepID=A0A1F8DGK3_9BACT|nr:MAG: arginine--tRNA ligase [Candidatus Woesebacteria bacterium RIFOXYD1_FULL_40_21]